MIYPTVHQWQTKVIAKALQACAAKSHEASQFHSPKKLLICVTEISGVRFNRHEYSRAAKVLMKFAGEAR